MGEELGMLSSVVKIGHGRFYEGRAARAQISGYRRELVCIARDQVKSLAPLRP